MADKNQIRVMVADKSSMARLIISDILNAEPGIIVVGTAADGDEMVINARSCHPQVVVMDADLPRNARNTAIRRLLTRQRVALVVAGDEDRISERTHSDICNCRPELLYTPKGRVLVPLRSIGDELVKKVRRAARRTFLAEYSETEDVLAEPASDAPVVSVPKLRRRKYHPPACLVVIGSSTGGNTAVEYILSRLQADFAGAVLVAQHMPPGFSNTFARRLNSLCAIEVKEASPGDLIEAGSVLIAPGETNLMVNTVMGNKNKLRVDGMDHHDGSSPFDRPSIDLLMHSAAHAAEVPVLGIILSGLGQDGARGGLAIREKDGAVWVQDPASTAVFGMGKAALEAGCVDKVLPLSEIPRYLDYHVRHLQQPSQFKTQEL